MFNQKIPTAELLIAPGCAHCPSVLLALSELLKESIIGELNVINVAVHPEAADQRNTRSVPWMRIGDFELEGSTEKQTLRNWATHAKNGTGLGEYLQDLLESQKLDKATSLASNNSDALHALLELASDLETPMGVRIGIGAVFEELPSSSLSPLIPQLLTLSKSEEISLRADAAHYLGLVKTPEAIVRLQAMLQDTHPDVKEIAEDALEIQDPQ